MNPLGAIFRQALFDGSTPDSQSSFDPRLGPIGSGRPQSNTPQVSNLLDGSTPGFESNLNPSLAPIGSGHPRSIVISNANNKLSSPQPCELVRPVLPSATQRAMPAVTRVKRDKAPKLYPHGDMSNLRPDDRGMDEATCIRFYHISTASNGEMPPIEATDSSDSNPSPSKKVTFDLGARFAVRSTEEQKAKCRIQSREKTDSEFILAKAMHERVIRELEEEDDDDDDDEITRFTCTCTLNNMTNSLCEDEDQIVEEQP